MTAARAAVLIAVALIASACTRRSAAAEKPVAAQTPPPAVITLERQPCFGTCPVYLLTVSGDGGVVFEGRRNVDSVGRFTAHLDAEHVAALVKLFDEIQFFALDDRYVMGAPGCQSYAADAPIVITSIVTRGRTKRVEHDAGCVGVPTRLGEIERAIDQIVGTARWIGKR